MAARCLQGGIESLEPAEREELRELFKKECRKGSFAPSGPDPKSVLIAFCEHVTAGFGDSDKVMAVIDFQPLLRATAGRLSAEAQRRGNPSIAALVLYATCLEHWVNMMITVAELRRGKTEEAILGYFKKQPPFEAKLALIGPRSGLSELPDTTRSEVKKLVDTRNTYVHYSWRGDRAVVHRRVANVASIVRRAPKLLATLDRYEKRNLDALYSRICRGVFGPAAG